MGERSSLAEYRGQRTAERLWEHGEFTRRSYPAQDEEWSVTVSIDDMRGAGGPPAVGTRQKAYPPAKACCGVPKSTAIGTCTSSNELYRPITRWLHRQGPWCDTQLTEIPRPSGQARENGQPCQWQQPSRNGTDYVSLSVASSTRPAAGPGDGRRGSSMAAYRTGCGAPGWT